MIPCLLRILHEHVALVNLWPLGDATPRIYSMPGRPRDATEEEDETLEKRGGACLERWSSLQKAVGVPMPISKCIAHVCEEKSIGEPFFFF
jgi:hypothetical protein